MAAADLALRLDPRMSPGRRAPLVNTYYFARKFERAIEVSDQIPEESRDKFNRFLRAASYAFSRSRRGCWAAQEADLITKNGEQVMEVWFNEGEVFARTSEQDIEREGLRRLDLRIYATEEELKKFDNPRSLPECVGRGGGIGWRSPASGRIVYVCPLDVADSGPPLNVEFATLDCLGEVLRAGSSCRVQSFFQERRSWRIRRIPPSTAIRCNGHVRRARRSRTSCSFSMPTARARASTSIRSTKSHPRGRRGQRFKRRPSFWANDNMWASTTSSAAATSSSLRL